MNGDFSEEEEGDEDVPWGRFQCVEKKKESYSPSPNVSSFYALWVFASSSFFQYLVGYFHVTTTATEVI